MSADNWTICPQCRKHVDKLNDARAKAPALNYGKVTAEQYLKLVGAAKNPVPYEETLREDYEIGIVQTDCDKPSFYVSYKAACQSCTFKYEFKETKPIKPCPTNP